MNSREIARAMVLDDAFVAASELPTPEDEDKIIDKESGVIYKPEQDAHVSLLHGIKFNGEQRF